MNQEREKAILQYLIKEKRVTVKEMAAKLYASEPSIRRDLASLEKQNLIKRVHGGAVLEENSISAVKIPFAIREMEQSDEKVAIARKAAEFVKDNDVVFLDGSTSAYNMIPFLVQKKNITVITSGIKTLLRLAEYGVKVISTGGESVNSCMSLVGEDAVRTVNNYNADVCFFSCRGIKNGELTDISAPENLVRRAMINRAKASYFLCAANKQDKSFFHKLCSKDDITGIITN